MALPPDRSALSTEQQHPRSESLHALTMRELVALFTDEQRAVQDAMQAAQPALSDFLENIADDFCAGGRVIYVGAGTSGRLGVLDASEAPPTFQVDPGRFIGLIAGGDGALRRSSEGLEDDPEGARDELAELQLTNRDTVIGIAAGGTTPYPLGALAIAKEFNCHTAFICCVDIKRPAHADHLIVLPTGPELLTGSTRLKAGTATKLALNTISTALMVRAGKVYRNLMVDVRATNNKLRDRAARIISTITGLDRAASFALLDRAGGTVKTAIVMHTRSCSQEQAEAELIAHNGRLESIIDTSQK